MRSTARRTFRPTKASHGEEQRLYRHYDMDHPSDEATVLVVLVAD